MHTKRLFYIGLAAIVLACLSISEAAATTMRGWVTAVLSPPWRTLSSAKEAIFKLPKALPGRGYERDAAYQQLQIENQQLRTLLGDLDDFQDQLVSLPDDYRSTDGTILVTPARVIFRSPLSWNSSFWIDVGSAHNAGLGSVIVAKNSPVVVGASLVGVIDHIGKWRSRVRLITDVGLVPAVRVARGAPQNQWLLQNLEAIVNSLVYRADLFVNTAEQERTLQLLAELRQKLLQHADEQYLAKGEIHGFAEPLWRGKKATLRGVGFNYDFADDMGPARDLRSGKPIDGSAGATPLVQLNDLLVTSGMDGIFPPGLFVATVTEVEPLQEGACFYNLKAEPVVKNLGDLQRVLVLPPLGVAKRRGEI